MTGPEHFKAAEDWLRETSQPLGSERRAQQLQVAQIHATLALAAATAMAAQNDGGRMARVDFDAWDKVCGVPRRPMGAAV